MRHACRAAAATAAPRQDEAVDTSLARGRSPSRLAAAVAGPQTLFQLSNSERAGGRSVGSRNPFAGDAYPGPGQRDLIVIAVQIHADKVIHFTVGI